MYYWFWIFFPDIKLKKSAKWTLTNYSNVSAIKRFVLKIEKIMEQVQNARNYLKLTPTNKFQILVVCYLTYNLKKYFKCWYNFLNLRNHS